jgi:hypothetical protein
VTYGFVPQHWYAFARELAERGVAVADIERIEMRPSGVPGRTDVIVTARSGQVYTWTRDERLTI